MGISAMPHWKQLPMAVVSLEFLILCIFSFSSARAQSVYFETCPAGASPCTSRIGHVANGNQSLSAIAKLYVVNEADIIGANNLDLTESGLTSKTLPSGKVLLIPFQCDCINGTRRTNSTVYTILPGDTLSKISDTYFGHLITYQEIGRVNNIPDLDQIQAGQSLIIPLPCACHNNTFNGAPAVFLTHVIQQGQDLSVIGATYGTTDADLATLNQIKNESAIKAYDHIQVPLSACASNFSSKALDYGLMVINGSYSLSPLGGCVQTHCYGYPSIQLHSAPARARLSNTTCPNLTCDGKLAIGNFTTTVAGNGRCSVTSCMYEGYANSSAIFTSLVATQESTCPVETAPPPEQEVEAAPTLPPPTSTSPSTSSPLGAPGAAPSSTTATLGSQILLSSVVGTVLSVSIPFLLLFTSL